MSKQCPNCKFIEGDDVNEKIKKSKFIESSHISVRTEFKDEDDMDFDYSGLLRLSICPRCGIVFVDKDNISKLYI
jgi:Zn-finger nucleic acid-binding protein